MIKVTVTNPNKLGSPWSAPFPTQDEAQAWYSKHEAKGIFGKSEHTVQEVDIPAVVDAWGNILAPATMKDVIVPSEFTVEIVDITAELEQQRVNYEALQYLAASDWKCLRHQDQLMLGIDTSLSSEEYANLLQSRQEARDRIVRG